MGLEIDHVLTLDMAATSESQRVRMRDILRTSHLLAGHAVDVTELRELLDELGILTPYQCARFPHIYGADNVVHYLDPDTDPNPMLDDLPSFTLCRVHARGAAADVEIRGWQEECTDLTELWFPHCIWCVIKAVVL